MTSPIRALIFDFDGLIIDTESPEFETWVEIFNEYGTHLEFKEWVACLGTSPDAFNAASILYQRTGIVVDNPTLWAEQKKRSIQKANRLLPLPGVVSILDEARMSGLDLAVASSSPRSWVVGHLSRLGLLEYFKYVLTREDVSNVKPDPELYQKTLELLGIKAQQAIVFEDSPNGIKAARRAGITCIAVPNPISKRLDLSEANFVMNSFADFNLQELLELISVHSNGRFPLSEKA